MSENACVKLTKILKSYRIESKNIIEITSITGLVSLNRLLVTL